MYGGDLPDFGAIPSIPPWFVFHIPDSLPLTSLLRRRVELQSIMPPTPDQLQQILTALRTHVTAPNLIASCTALGKGEKFKTAKPHDGVYAYIWRMGRFHGGDATAASFEALWELEEGIVALTGINICIDLNDKRQRPLLAFVNAWSKELVTNMGEDCHHGLLRFGRSQGLGL